MSKHEKLFNRMRLPKDYWECKIGELPDNGSDRNKYKKPYKEVISNYVLRNLDEEDVCKGFHLYGDYGSGKSGIGGILIQSAVYQGKTALWVDFPLLQEYSINKEKHIYEGEVTLFDRMHEVDVLFVDEILCDNSSRWPLKVMESLVRVRYQNCKTTHMASNSTPNKLGSTGVSKGLSNICRGAMISLQVEGKKFRK